VIRLINLTSKIRKPNDGCGHPLQVAKLQKYIQSNKFKIGLTEILLRDICKD